LVVLRVEVPSRGWKKLLQDGRGETQTGLDTGKAPGVAREASEDELEGLKRWLKFSLVT
jgi:hypothetical protein